MNAARKRAEAEAHNARYVEAQAYAEDRVRHPPIHEPVGSEMTTLMAMEAMTHKYLNRYTR